MSRKLGAGGAHIKSDAVTAFHCFLRLGAARNITTLEAFATLVRGRGAAPSQWLLAADHRGGNQLPETQASNSENRTLAAVLCGWERSVWI